MKELYKCGTCGVITEQLQQVCVPEAVSDKDDYCGSGVDRDKMCGHMQQQIPFVCGSCGRAAEQAELLCVPLVVG